MSFGLIYRIDCGEFSVKKLDSGCWNTVLLNLVGGGCNVGLIKVVGGGGSNVGTSEVVEGGGIEVVGEVGGERIDFRRVGGGDVVSLDIFGVRRLTEIRIVFELGEESLVLLPSSNSTG